MSVRQHARQWEPRTIALSDAARSLVDEAVEAQFITRKDRLASVGSIARRNRGQRADKERSTVEALVLDVLAHWLCNLPEYLVIKLDSNWLSAGPREVTARNRTVNDRLYDLCEAGWLVADKKTRLNNYFVTSLSAGPELIRASRSFNVTLADIGVRPSPSEIELRGWKPKGAMTRRPLLEFEPTDETDAIQAQLEELNDCLRAATLNSARYDAMHIDVRRRTVSRAFLDEAFNRGGRLKGAAFWLSLRKDVRRSALQIDGEPIAEVDIQAAMPTIAYALEGTKPLEDPYQLPQPVDIPRDAVKLTLMQMLWTPIGKQSRLAEEARKLVPSNYPAGEVFQLIRQHNAPIAHRLGNPSPCGAELMWHESEVIIAATLRCFSGGFSALPLHDALLVPASRAGQAKNILGAAFEARLGIRPNIKVEIFDR